MGNGSRGDRCAIFDWVGGTFDWSAECLLLQLVVYALFLIVLESFIFVRSCSHRGL